MTDCTKLSDRMPAVALGRSRWTAEEEHHLAACADCREEWAVLLAGSRLGAAIPPTIDVSATAAHVLARLAARRARTIRARRWTVAGLGAAAAIVLALWTGRRVGVAGSPPPPIAVTPRGPVAPAPAPPRLEPSESVTGAPAGAPWELPLPELDSLPAEALDSILRVWDEPLAQVDGDDRTFDDPGDLELEHLLAGMEG